MTSWSLSQGSSVRGGTWASTSAGGNGAAGYPPSAGLGCQGQTQDRAHLRFCNGPRKGGAQVLVAGMTPSVMFGVGVTGIAAAAAISGSEGVLRSVDLGMDPRGRHDARVELITGPLCQYVAEWWRAADSCTSFGTHLSPGFLVNAFRSAKAGAACVAAALKSRVQPAVAWQSQHTGLRRMGERDPSLKQRSLWLVDQVSAAGKAADSARKSMPLTVCGRARRSNLQVTTSIPRAPCGSTHQFIGVGNAAIP